MAVSHSAAPIDLLRLSREELRSVLMRLCELELEGKGAELREAERKPAIGLQVLLRLNNSEDYKKSPPYRVLPTDLSEGGVGFLHGTFVHPGTQCSVTLATKTAKPVEVEGQIVRCQLVSGRAHSLGVKFDAPISVDQFTQPADTAAS